MDNLLCELPSEVIANIVRYLQSCDMINLRCTCRFLSSRFHISWITNDEISKKLHPYESHLFHNPCNRYECYDYAFTYIRDKTKLIKVICKNDNVKLFQYINEKYIKCDEKICQNIRQKDLLFYSIKYSSINLIDYLLKFINLKCIPKIFSRLCCIFGCGLSPDPKRLAVIDYFNSNNIKFLDININDYINACSHSKLYGYAYYIIQQLPIHLQQKACNIFYLNVKKNWNLIVQCYHHDEFFIKNISCYYDLLMLFDISELLKDCIITNKDFIYSDILKYFTVKKYHIIGAFNNVFNSKRSIVKFAKMNNIYFFHQFMAICDNLDFDIVCKVFLCMLKTKNGVHCLKHNYSKKYKDFIFILLVLYGHKTLELNNLKYLEYQYITQKQCSKIIEDIAIIDLQSLKYCSYYFGQNFTEMLILSEPYFLKLIHNNSKIHMEYLFQLGKSTKCIDNVKLHLCKQNKSFDVLNLLLTLCCDN